MNCTPGKAARDGILYGILLLALSPVALGQSAPGSQDRPLLLADTSESSTPKSLVYTPPRRGAPVRRVGGGTRTSDTSATTVSVLAPESVGLTTHAQPTLYWFVSDTVDNRVVVTVVDEDAIDPLLELTLAAPEAPGIHALDLADLGVRLEPGRHYEWEVALIDASGDRHRDIYARGAIERVAASANLQAKLEGRAPMEKARVLAEAGIWYDAVDELSRAIAKSSDARAFDAERRSLLTQVNLDAAAGHAQ
jgi:hypothetical protein